MVLGFTRIFVDIVCFLTPQCVHDCWTCRCCFVGVCRSFISDVNWMTSYRFFMLCCVKNVDCVIVLQLVWEQNLFNLAVAKEVDIISYPELCLPVQSALWAFCPAALALCSSVLALICSAVMGSRGVLYLNIACRIWLLCKRPISGGQCLRFAAEAFAIYSVGRLLEGFMLALVEQYETK